MSEANNVHPSEIGLAVAATIPVLSKKEQAKLANILGFFRDAADAVFPVQGFEVVSDPSVDVLLERMEALKPGTLVAQRARLEADPHFRHPIPYILIFRQRDDGSLEFFVYQRTKLIGEDLLGQKFSIALGGHPEVESIRFHADGSFNTPESLMSCLVTELDEEATFNGMSFSDYTETGGLYTFSHEGFIRDDSDKVGLQHIGIVYTIGLPAGVEVECKEEELITVGFRTLEELDTDLELPEVNAQYDFENWSKLCIRSYVERIEATKAAEAVDALFLAESGHDEAGGGVDLVELETPMCGENPHMIHMDELPFLPPAGDEPATLGGGTYSTDITSKAECAPIGVAVAGTGGVMNAFAQELLGQLATPVDPSGETAVLTELHREIGVSDDQMKRGVEELVRISDSVQPDAEEEATRLSDLAS